MNETDSSSIARFDSPDLDNMYDPHRGINQFFLRSSPPSPLLPPSTVVPPCARQAIFFSGTNLISHETFIQSGKIVRTPSLVIDMHFERVLLFKTWWKYTCVRCVSYARAYTCAAGLYTARLSRLSLLFHIGISRESDVSRGYIVVHKYRASRACNICNFLHDDVHTCTFSSAATLSTRA